MSGSQASHAQVGLDAGPRLESLEHPPQRAYQTQRLQWIGAQGLDCLSRLLQPISGQGRDLIQGVLDRCRLVDHQGA